MSLKYILIFLAMLTAAGLAYALKPTQRLAGHGTTIDLETMIPKQFGEWKVEQEQDRLMVSPDVQASLNKIYNQTLTRTYVNDKGQRVMLSIAYGADQSDNLQVHMPEGCYAGQGFAVEAKVKTVLQTPFGVLPVARLVAYQGARHEPITYWVVVGGEIATDTWEMKKIKLRFTLKGELADGLLVRISNITLNTNEGYAVQHQFVEAMITSLPPESRARLFGKAK